MTPKEVIAKDLINNLKVENTYKAIIWSKFNIVNRKQILMQWSHNFEKLFSV